MKYEDLKLGMRVRDDYTGFEGVATGSARFVNGCDRVEITPTELKEGALKDCVWLDIQRVSVVGNAPAVEAAKPGSAGGPMNDPTRHGIAGR